MVATWVMEYQEALGYPKVQVHHRMNEAEIAAVIADVRRAAILIPPQLRVQPPLPDQDDTMFFACAVAGEARYIVSGDRQMQEVGEYKGIQVVSPSLFLRVL